MHPTTRKRSSSSSQPSRSLIGSHSVSILQSHASRPTEFIIDVHDFRATKILSSYGAEPLRGRGTRVFEAFELDERGQKKGTAVVLKVIWIDNDRAREGSILAQLYVADAEDKKLLKTYFLTAVRDGDV